MRRAVYVNHKDNADTILGKAFDFSYLTIKELLQKGYHDATEAYIQAIEDELERALVGVSYPVNNIQIMEHISKNNKQAYYDSERVRNFLRCHPESKRYSSIEEVLTAARQHTLERK